MLPKEILKPYLLKTPEYKGGKGIHEIKSKANKIYKLSSNENPIGSSPKATQSVQETAQNLHIYPDRTGDRLQDALVDFYNQELSRDHFVPTNSGSETIEFIARGFMKEGLECIVSNPSFMPYTMFSGWNGAKVIDIPLLSPTYEVDIDGILAAINERTRLIFITSPNNPTGTYISKEKIDKLMDNIPSHVIVVLDEVYYHFADAADFTTALPYVKEGKNIIAVNSFSKTYGLAALRIGYMYSTPEIAGYLRRLYRPFLINIIGLNAGIAALSDIEFINKTVEIIQTERPRFYELFDELGLTYWKTQANFVLFKSPIEPKLLIDTLLEEGGVMVRNAGSFGAPGCIRVTVGTKEANDAFFTGMKQILIESLVETH
ncbi:MAG: histidinol-phosphate transaminase [Saprospiraceae bacterium]